MKEVDVSLILITIGSSFTLLGLKRREWGNQSPRAVLLRALTAVLTH